MVIKQADVEIDPAYLFKVQVEDLTFFGENDKTRIANALAFTHLRALVMRFGQSMTPDEIETLKAFMESCVVVE
jgi:hypothetical protein